MGTGQDILVPGLMGMWVLARGVLLGQPGV